MIRSIRDRHTRMLLNEEPVRRFQSFERMARRKLESLNAATNLAELAAIPGNRLESLKGDRAGRYSIRVNQQWRICFRWMDGDAHDVEIVDYH